MNTPQKITIIIVIILVLGALVFHFAIRPTLQLMKTDYMVDFRDWDRIKVQRAGSTNVSLVDREGLARTLSQAPADAKRKTILIRYVGADDYFYMAPQPLVKEVEGIARGAGFTTILSSAPAPGNQQQAFFDRVPDTNRGR